MSYEHIMTMTSAAHDGPLRRYGAMVSDGPNAKSLVSAPSINNKQMGLDDLTNK